MQKEEERLACVKGGKEQVWKAVWMMKKDESQQTQSKGASVKCKDVYVKRGVKQYEGE